MDKQQGSTSYLKDALVYADTRFKMRNLEALRQAVELLATGDWQRAHAIAQADESQNGCWIHGIVHLLEGDRDNARYWYRRAGREFPTNFSVVSELNALRNSLSD